MGARERINFLLKPAQFKRMQNAAEQMGITQAELLRTALEAYLEHRKTLGADSSGDAFN